MSNYNTFSSFKAGVGIKKFELGVMVSYYRFSYDVDSRYTRGPWEPWNLPFVGYDKFIAAEKAFAVQFYVNRKITLGKSELYTGIALGQGKFNINSAPTQWKEFYMNGEKETIYDTRDWNTFTATLQAGYNYHLNKHLALNAELNGNCIIPYDLKLDYYRYLYSIPLTVGIHYSLL